MSFLGIPLKPIILSLIFPGLGQYYISQKKESLIFGTIEVVNTSFLAYSILEGKEMWRESKIYAYNWANANFRRNEFSYWRMVEVFPSYEEYYNALLVEARNLFPDDPQRQLDYVRQNDVGDPWIWEDLEKLNKFRDLMATIRGLEDWRNISLTAFILNRLVSILHLVVHYKTKSILYLNFNPDLTRVTLKFSVGW